jgi:hypothetical protein
VPTSIQSEPVEAAAGSEARLPEARAAAGQGGRARLLALQRAAGNRAVGRLVARMRNDRPAVQVVAREPAETAPDPLDYETFEDYAAAAPSPWSLEYLQAEWDKAAVGNDVTRTSLILGAKLLSEEAKRLSTGIFRGLHERDVESLAKGEGMDPVAGRVPNPPANPNAELNTAERTFRHLRPVQQDQALPPWTPYEGGTDRISWTESLDVASGRGKGWGTNIARLVDDPASAGVVMRGPRQLLADLQVWRAHLQRQLEVAPNSKVRGRLKWDIKSIERCEAHVVELLEQETVGHVPNEAVITHVGERISLARNGGRFLAGLSVMLSAYEIIAADPDRRDEIAVDVVAAFAADLISPIPTAGPIVRYASESARGEFHPATMVMPIPPIWLIDAFLGGAMEENDPAGAARIRSAMGNSLLETYMYMDLFAPGARGSFPLGR